MIKRGKGKGEVVDFALMRWLMETEIRKISDDGALKRYNNLWESDILSPALTQWPSLKLIIFHFLSWKDVVCMFKRATNQLLFAGGKSILAQVWGHLFNFFIGEIRWTWLAFYSLDRNVYHRPIEMKFRIYDPQKDNVQMLLFHSYGVVSFLRDINEPWL